MKNSNVCNILMSLLLLLSLFMVTASPNKWWHPGGRGSPNLSGETHRAKVIITDKSKPQAVIVIGVQATELEKLAAVELSRYIKMMSGAEISVESEKDKLKSKNIILIGRPETNDIIKELCRKGLIKLSKDYPGLDGFIIKTLHFKPLPFNALILGGSQGPGTLYAVYHLLENIFQVGFFWDGERVPRQPSLMVDNLDIVEKPFFPDRQYLQGCAFAYTTGYWTWEDWKKEIEWTAKKKFNLVMVPWGSVDKKVFPKFGVDLGDLTEYEKYRIELSKKIANYARSLGIRTILPGYMGWVPAEFVKLHPECRYVDVKWGESPSAAHLYPGDPMFLKVGEAFIRQYIQGYGTDHIYNIDPYPETQPGATPEEKGTIKLEFAKAVCKYIKAADPEGIWYASGWAFLDRNYWPEEAVKDFLEAIPDDMFYVCDIWAERNPLYKELDYFHTKKWGFSVLHSFGGDDYLHGDLADLIKRAQEIPADRKAKNCQVFYINPEIIHYNTLYFELAAKLGWNPKRVDLNQFLTDYALRRYGKESAANMVKVLKKLARSVYGSPGGKEAVYQHRLAEMYIYPLEILPRLQVISDLQEALDLALREKEKQKGNLLYQHDLVDILRQYISELFNLHIQKLYAAFQKGDQAEVEVQERTIERLMDGLEKILASREDYCIEPIIRKAQAAPGAPDDIDKAIRDAMFTFTGMSWLLDYQSKDMYELVKFYYRRRVNAYIETLRKKMAEGNTQVSMSDLEEIYRKIEADWLETPLAVSDKYQGPILQAVEEVFKSIKPLAIISIPPLIVPGVKAAGKAGWEEDFSDISDWHQTYEGGKFTTDGKIGRMESQAKWFLYGTDISVSIREYPILSFCYKIEKESPAGGAWIWVTWEDAKGKETRTLIWREGTSKKWAQVNIDLEALLSFISQPVKIKRIELNNQEPPNVSLWDWLRICQRRE